MAEAASGVPESMFPFAHALECEIEEWPGTQKLLLQASQARGPPSKGQTGIPQRHGLFIYRVNMLRFAFVFAQS